MNLQKVFASKAPIEIGKDKEDEHKEEGKNVAIQKEQETIQIDTKPSQSTTPDVMIDNITLQGGTIDFYRFPCEAVFSAKLKKLGGRIHGSF